MLDYLRDAYINHNGEQPNNRAILKAMQDKWPARKVDKWSGLPPALRDHLFERLRERKITAEDLYRPPNRSACAARAACRPAAPRRRASR